MSAPTAPSPAEAPAASSTAVVITPEAFLAHWQAHRRLTRRVIEAFPDDQLFTFSIAGMRPFGVMAVELLRMAGPMVNGVATGTYASYENTDADTKAEVLRQWDASTEAMNAQWGSIPTERFGETQTAFGQYTDIVINLLLYVVDNEIHHRAQGYVYLRALGIDPPAFWDRQ